MPKRMLQKNWEEDGLASVIKYEGDNNTLVWKHPIEDFNMGSQLIVHESQEAIFFRDGQALDLFGAGRYTLETQQLPIFEKVYQLPTTVEDTFHSEVYFINIATQLAIKWGTDSKVRLFDPKSGLHLELGASGEFNIKVINSRKLLLKIVGNTNGIKNEQILGADNGKGFFRALIITQVKVWLAKTIKEHDINILEIDAELLLLSNLLREQINVTLFEYGLEITEFFVNRIVTPDDDPNFRRMKEQYAEQYLLVRQEEIKRSEAEAAAIRKAVEVQTDAQMKIIAAKGEAEAIRIKQAAQSEAYKMQAEAEATEMRLKNYNYQQETSRMIGLEAMQNGLTGNGSGASSSLGDIAELGVALGAMSGVIGLTKDFIQPVLNDSNQIGTNIAATMTDIWICSCGKSNNGGNFCSNCGSKKIENRQQDDWVCSCGERNSGNFCSNCGKRKEG